MLTARLFSMKDRQRARLEKELAVAELAEEKVKAKAKVLKVLKKVGSKIKKLKK